MKTVLTFSLLPIIVVAFFFSKQLYIAGDYVAAYALIAVAFASLVYFIYQAGPQVQNWRIYREKV